LDRIAGFKSKWTLFLAQPNLYTGKYKMNRTVLQTLAQADKKPVQKGGRLGMLVLGEGPQNRLCRTVFWCCWILLEDLCSFKEQAKEPQENKQTNKQTKKLFSKESQL
jgi:hypothetical protein